MPRCGHRSVKSAWPASHHIAGRLTRVPSKSHHSTPAIWLRGNITRWLDAQSAVRLASGRARQDESGRLSDLPRFKSPLRDRSLRDLSSRWRAALVNCRLAQMIRFEPAAISETSSRRTRPMTISGERRVENTNAVRSSGREARVHVLCECCGSAGADRPGSLRHDRPQTPSEEGRLVHHRARTGLELRVVPDHGLDQFEVWSAREHVSLSVGDL